MIEKITEATLDAVYRLQRKRVSEIEESNDLYTINRNIITPGILEGSSLYLLQNAPVKVGDLLNLSTVKGAYLVLSVTDEAGRLNVSVEYLPESTAVCTKTSRGISPAGIPCWSIKLTNWNDIPCKRTGKTVIIPARYTPDRGDLLVFDSKYFEVINILQNGPLCVCTVQEL